MIHILTWQKCRVCGGKFTDTGRELICTKCKTTPTKFYLRWFYKSEQFIRSTFHSYNEALTTAVIIEGAIKSKKFDPELYRGASSKIPNRYHMDTVTGSYLKERKQQVSWTGADDDGISPGTYRKIEQHLHEFEAWCKENDHVDIRSIRNAEIREFKNHLRDTNKAKTIKNKMADIKKFFSDTRSFLGKDYIPDMPEFEKIKVKDAEVGIMDALERDRVMSNIPAEHKPIFLFWQATGVRPCELTALKKQHIVWNAKIPYWKVQAELISGGIYRTITKTKNQWPIPLKVNDIAIIKSVPLTFTDYVFYWIDTRHKGKAKPYREQMLRNIWRDACAASGVEYRYPYQSFRHSTITGWLDSGMSEDDASSLVGHKCRSTIKKYDKSMRIERLMRAKENL